MCSRRRMKTIWLISLTSLPQELPVYVVGVGSNLIVRDGGMPGVVIRLSPARFGETSVDGDIVSAGTAALDKRVAETAAAANLSGLEFFFGIPGTIGGALRMNAGANGGETKDVLIEATGIGRDGTQASLHQCRHEIRLSQQRRRSVDHFYLRAISWVSRRAGSDPCADERGAKPSRDRAADPGKDRRLDLQESARQQRLETDRRRRLPRLARRRRAGVGNALQFPDQHRQRDRPRHRDAGRDRARTGQAEFRN